MRFLLFSLLCLLSLSGLRAQTSSPQLSKKERQAAALRMQRVTSAAGRNYDLRYHRAYWQVDPAVRYIKGAVTSYFVVNQQGADTISFDLSHALQVDSIRFHGAAVPFSLAANVLRIDLPGTLPVGRLDSISIWYKGVPPQTGLGSFMRTAHTSGPIIWTLSDPYGGKDWWPCKMSLDDKIDSIDIFVQAPQANRVASNGVLVSERQLGTDKVFHWRHRYPITSYLICMAVTNYAAYSDLVPLRGDTLEVLNYVYPHTLAAARTQTPRVIPIMQLYDSIFGPYPFMREKYGHAQFGWGGGMEHQTMSFMTDFSQDLIAHELSHQWFGNKVTCGSWHDMWLNEGWATYVTGLTYERLRTPAQWLQWKNNQIASAAVANGSVWVADTTDPNAIFHPRLVYDKGSMVLHMLRWMVGDSAFFTGTRNYLNDPQLKFKYARTADFQRHLEQASGKNLGGFLQDWIYGQGYPRYQVSWAQDAQTGLVTVTLGQTQSHPSVSFFEMPVPVRFSSGSQDTLLVFDHTSSGQAFTFQPGFAVSTVTLDPDKWLLQRNSAVVTAAPEMAAQTSFKVYPNPSTGRVTVRFSRPLLTSDQVVLRNLTGQTVQQLRAGLTGQTETTLDLSGLPVGVYLVQWQTGKATVGQKLVYMP